MIPCCHPSSMYELDESRQLHLYVCSLETNLTLKLLEVRLRGRNPILEMDKIPTSHRGRQTNMSCIGVGNYKFYASF